MKHLKMRSATRLMVAAWLLTGVASSVPAGSPGESPDPEQARAAIEDARRLRDALQLHLAEPAALEARPVRGDGRPARAGIKVRSRGRRPGGAAADNGRVGDAAWPGAERHRRPADRASVHAERSLARISDYLETADRKLARSPHFALHRVDLALYELRKVEKRLGIRLEPLEVQP